MRHGELSNGDLASDKRGKNEERMSIYEIPEGGYGSLGNDVHEEKRADEHREIEELRKVEASFVVLLGADHYASVHEHERDETEHHKHVRHDLCENIHQEALQNPAVMFKDAPEPCERGLQHVEVVLPRVLSVFGEVSEDFDARESREECHPDDVRLPEENRSPSGTG